MGFQHGLSGLNVASANLDAIGNNIANANTVGFKQSTVEFSDVFANSLGGGGGNKIGIGTEVAAVKQQFSQGNISTTNNPLDVAINGGGFFRMSNEGEVTYSRNGQFHIDNSGYIVNSQNLNLMGYLPDAAGKILQTEPANLQLSTADINPKITSKFSAGFNLDSRTVSPAVLPVFDATDPNTYTSSTSGSIFDSLGNSHVMTLYFQKTPTSGTWNAYATVDGASSATGVPIGVDLGSGIGLPQSIIFDSNGILTTPAAPLTTTISLDLIATDLGTANNASTPLVFSMDLSKATQFGGSFGVNSLSQDGFASGRLAGFSVGGNGMISGSYTNGETRNLGQIVLANFSNPQGLIPRGNGGWSESSASGTALVGVPSTGPLGALQASAVEDSNVDLTAQLVNMITAQRVYQANAKTIETQDAVLQTLIQL
ncbi:MAG: flagellar hook protein FlgE [Nitrosomonas sp.]|nr:flagellar hook protein FlgE [Nitrosomonas sp.]MDP1950146.1 flagellar hook protein FlgE [Nitrosomonas sp.]